ATHQLSMWSELGSPAVMPRGGHRHGLRAIWSEKVDDGELASAAGEGVCNPFAIRSECVGAHGTLAAMRDQRTVARLDIHSIQVLASIAIKQVFAVRTPNRVEFISSTVLRELLGGCCPILLLNI